MTPSQWRPRAQVMEAASIIHLTWKRYLEAKLLPHGVSMKQAALLGMIRAEGFIHPAAVAEAFFCDRPTATSLIDTLMRRGWVERAKDPQDGRKVRVVLTDAGRVKLASLPADASRNHPQAEDPLGCFTAEERSTLVDLLDRLADHVQRISTVPADEG